MKAKIADYGKKFKKYLKNYGLAGGLQFGWLAFLRIIGLNIRYYRFYYKGDTSSEIVLPEGFTVGIPASGDIAKTGVGKARYDYYIHRLFDENEAAGAIFKEEKMVYSWWLSKSLIRFPGGGPMPVQTAAGELFLSDCYCDHEYRGLGLHTAVIASIDPAEYDKKHVTTLVDKFNTPSIRGFERAGYKFIFTFYTVQFRKKVWSDFSKKRKRYYLSTSGTSSSA